MKANEDWQRMHSSSCRGRCSSYRPLGGVSEPHSLGAAEQADELAPSHRSPFSLLVCRTRQLTLSANPPYSAAPHAYCFTQRRQQPAAAAIINLAAFILGCCSLRHASNRRLALEPEAIEIAAFAHIVVRVGLVHDAAVIPQHPVAEAPRVAIFVFALSGVAHQLIDQRQRIAVLHADDRFHPNRIEEQRLATILGMST